MQAVVGGCRHGCLCAWGCALWCWSLACPENTLRPDVFGRVPNSRPSTSIHAHPSPPHATHLACRARRRGRHGLAAPRWSRCPGRCPSLRRCRPPRGTPAAPAAPRCPSQSCVRSQRRLRGGVGVSGDWGRLCRPNRTGTSTIQPCLHSHLQRGSSLPACPTAPPSLS